MVPVLPHVNLAAGKVWCGVTEESLEEEFLALELIASDPHDTKPFSCLLPNI